MQGFAWSFHRSMTVAFIPRNELGSRIRLSVWGVGPLWIFFGRGVGGTSPRDPDGKIVLEKSENVHSTGTNFVP
jgi:hypothetical protein